MELIDKNLQWIAGGNPIVNGIITATMVYVGGVKIINESIIYKVVKATEDYNHFGRFLGKCAFNLTNPDPLGKMVYPTTDFE